MYADKLVKVPNYRLVRNKKYYIIRTRSDIPYNECDVFTGFFVCSQKSKHHNSSDSESDIDSEDDSRTHRLSRKSVDSQHSDNENSDNENSDNESDETPVINYIQFTKLRNMITLKKLENDWSFTSKDVTCYEMKRPIQKIMENTYFKKIIRTLIGDNDFTHYLFEEIKTDYIMLKDNLISDNTDYEIHEVFCKYKYKNYWYVMDYILNIFKKILIK